MINVKDSIKKEIQQVLKRHFQNQQVNFKVDYPPTTKWGDYSCNVALLLAKKLKQSPLAVAEQMARYLNASMFEKVEIVAPGFINFYLTEDCCSNEVLLNSQKEDR